MLAVHAGIDKHTLSRIGLDQIPTIGMSIRTPRSLPGVSTTFVDITVLKIE
ncbi:MAG: hypothetical protein R2843_15055 [Thermomicrobiales bacterium]